MNTSVQSFYANSVWHANGGPDGAPCVSVRWKSSFHRDTVAYDISVRRHNSIRLMTQTLVEPQGETENKDPHLHWQLN